MHSMTNPNAAVVARAWPESWRAGLLSVAKPASSYDLRNYSMEDRRKDLERRAKRYREKKNERTN